MRISSTNSIEGGKVIASIGKIKAASSWHAEGTAPHQGNWRERLLEELARRAEDIGADAVIDVGYEVDGDKPTDEAGVALQRVLVTGIAVKLSYAA
jgi:uncharacterized protein YbjQ (UPF0145 family)